MDEAEALATVAAAGIHRLRIPTPFAVGRVNCYLLEDEPLTLVAPGPNSGKSLDELQRQLDDAGHSIEEIELIVITHQHIDHLGLVEIIASRSGAEVAAIDVVVPFVESYGTDVQRDDEFAGALMRRYGIPDDVVSALRSVSASFRGWARRRPSRGRSPTASCSSFAIARSRSSTRRGPAPRTPCSGTPSARS
jgi:glyoxylase-like metal-dependent hydrolase (beta-lactamase superfamily II)